MLATPAVSATKSVTPTMARSTSERDPAPGVARSATATTGNANTDSWFQIPVIVTASATGFPRRPHERSIANEAAMPTGAPPGTSELNAVEACVMLNALSKPRPGSATIHGGANVKILTTVARNRAATHGQVSP